MPRSWLNATVPSVSLLPLFVVPVQVTDDEFYAYFQQLVESSPAEFWEPVAQRELHWLHTHRCAWVTYTPGAQWMGWHAQTAMRIQVADSWSPWPSCCDDTLSPFVR